jgi:phospholipid/cholesterol/gamma-HCH transport system substrate-binding protein
MSGSLRLTILKLAAFTALTLSLTGLLAAIIGNIQPFTRFYGVTAEFSDVTGLLNTDVVKVAGVTVGKVAGSKVVISPRTGRAKAVVFLKVRNDIAIPRNVRAAIRFRNLLGQRMVVITRDPGEPDAPPMPRNGKAVIPLDRTTPPFDLGIVFNNLKPVLQSLDAQSVNTVSRAIVQIFGGREAELQQMVSNLADVSQALAQRGPVVTDLVTNISHVAATVSSHDADLASVLDSLDAIVGTLGNRSGELARAVDNLGVASAGTAKIIADNRPGLDDTIAKLRVVLDMLARQKSDLDAALKTLPATTDALDRATTYGEWANLNGVCINGVCGAGFSSNSTGSLTNAVAGGMP